MNRNLLCNCKVAKTVDELGVEVAKLHEDPNFCIVGTCQYLRALTFLVEMEILPPDTV